MRRPNRDEEPEPTSKNPINGNEVPITQLECPSTKVRGEIVSSIELVYCDYLLKKGGWEGTINQFYAAE